MSALALKIYQFINTVFTSNTFVVVKGNECLIIDLGDWEPVKDFIQLHNLSPKALLITHVHYDHIYGISKFMKDFPEIPIFTNQEGESSFKDPKWNFSRYHDDPISIDSPQIKPLSGKTVNPEEIKDFRELEKLNELIIHPNFSIYYFPTPGHDHSCITYLIEDNIFTGDSYIPGIKVISTFPKSDKQLAKNWYRTLEKMTDNFNVYPGHGEILRKKDNNETI